MNTTQKQLIIIIQLNKHILIIINKTQKYNNKTQKTYTNNN